MRTLFSLSAYCLAFAMLLSYAPEAFAQKVKVDFDREFDFSGLKTYAWKIHPRMENDAELRRSVGAELVRMAVSRELLDKGFVPAEGESADFYVTGFGSRDRRSEVTGVVGSWYSTGAYWAEGWETVMVTDYMEGTLVLDIVDAKTGQLAWRAYCQGATRNPSKRDKVVDKALKKAFKSFPPKP